jgi:hypothetical protein
VSATVDIVENRDMPENILVSNRIRIRDRSLRTLNRISNQASALHYALL